MGRRTRALLGVEVLEILPNMLYFWLATNRGEKRLIALILSVHARSRAFVLLTRKLRKFTRVSGLRL